MNWEDIKVKEFSQFRALPVGGYEVKILAVEEELTNSKRPKLNLKIDISKGEYKDYFKEQYEKDTRIDRKWANNGYYSVLIDIDDKTLPFYKALITAIEKSNNTKIIMERDTENNKFTFDYKKIVNLKFGVIFGLEEYTNTSGELKTSTKIRFVRSLTGDFDISKSDIPKVKMLDGSYVDYIDYLANKQTKTSGIVEFSNGVTISDDLPFDIEI